MCLDAETRRSTDATRLYPIIDRLFFVFLALVILASVFFAPLALLVAACSLFTRVRASRWRVIVLFSLALLLVVTVMAPFLPGFQALLFTHEGSEIVVG